MKVETIDRINEFDRFVKILFPLKAVIYVIFRNVVKGETRVGIFLNKKKKKNDIVEIFFSFITKSLVYIKLYLHRKNCGHCKFAWECKYRFNDHLANTRINSGIVFISNVLFLTGYVMLHRSVPRSPLSFPSPLCVRDFKICCSNLPNVTTGVLFTEAIV